jgi:hypothetical protein
MLHRHLNHDLSTPAAIDDIIERGLLPDWIRLARVVRADPQGEVAATVRRICDQRLQDELAARQSLAFWRHYIKAAQQ